MNPMQAPNVGVGGEDHRDAKNQDFQYDCPKCKRMDWKFIKTYGLYSRWKCKNCGEVFVI